MSEPELPGIPAPSKPPLYRRLFARWKWPGWAAIGLGSTRLFHLWEDLDFAFNALRALGGELGITVAVITSPFFAMGLVVYGVLHLMFVGEPHRALRHQAWAYLGWGVFGVCFAALGITAIWGAAELEIQKEVGKRYEALQQDALGHPVFWHLTEYNRTALGTVLDGIPVSKRFIINIKCLPDASSRTFADDIAAVFTDHKWKITGNCLFNDLKPDLLGFWIAISPTITVPSDVPKDAVTLAQFFADAGINFKIGHDGTLKHSEFALEVGNGP